MRFIEEIRKISLTVGGCLVLAAGAFAQETATPTPTPTEQIKPTETKEETVQEKEIPKIENVSNPTPTPETETKKEATGETEVSEKTDDETKDVTNLYVNYLKEYRLGPEDIISVEVFGQPEYSRAGINIPPTSTISYKLIPGGVFVGGKTTEQVAKEIAKKLDEYIIDPQVTVSLEKVGSARYAVMGDVTQPGIRPMTRRVTAMTALMEAGGVLNTGSMRKAIIYRNSGMGYTQVAVNLDDVRKGKANDVELQPGDQLFIPGNKMKTFNNILEVVSKASSFRLLFGSPF